MPWFRLAPVGGGTADVTGPASSTDNAIVRFDGTTGKLIQNSAVTIDDSGNVSAASISITSPLTVANGGTGAATLTGLLQGNGTSAFTAITNSSTVGQVLRVTGAATYAWGALDLTDGDAITGALGASNGGTGLSSLGTGVATWLGTPSAANLRSAVTGTTGSGNLVFDGSPTLVTPVLGAATATSINGLTITSSTGTLTITNGKTLSVSNTLTLAGTDGTTMTFPSTTATIARTDAGQTFTGVNTFTSPSITTGIDTGSTTFGLLTATATTINFAGASGAVVNLGGGANAAELRFLEPSGSGTNYTALKAQAQSANITYTLPATVGAAGTVLTDAAGNGTLSWVAPASGSVPSAELNFGFETAGRYNTSLSNGTATFGTVGVLLDTTATGGRSAAVYASQNKSFTLFAQDMTFSGVFQVSALPGSNDPEFYFGTNRLASTGAGITFTEDHFGFTVKRVAGAQNLYATMADGTTQQTSLLTTVAADDNVMVIATLNAGTSVSFYYSINFGNWSSATTLSTNPPRTSATCTEYFSAVVDNDSVAAAIAMFIQNVTLTWPQA